MPAIGNIIINDGLGTPVAHTFAPVGIKNDIATFEDRALAVYVGYPTMTLSVTRPSKTSKFVKARIRIVVPQLETLGNNTVSGIVPAPTKGFENSVDMVFMMHQRSNLVMRTDLLAYAKNVLAHATVSPLVLTNEAIY